jgi:hypothetical protein
MCRRASDDPLINMLFHQYGFQLLSTPRFDVKVGHAVVGTSRRASLVGPVDALLAEREPLPLVSRGTPLVPIEGVASSTYSQDASFGILDRVLEALGLDTTVAARLKHDGLGSDAIRFRFGAPEQDMIVPGQLGLWLRKARFDAAHPVLARAEELWLVGAVLKCKSLEIARGSASEVGTAGELKAPAVASAVVESRAWQTADWGIRYAGEAPVVFGVRMHRVIDWRGPKPTLEVAPKPTQLLSSTASVESASDPDVAETFLTLDVA